MSYQYADRKRSGSKTVGKADTAPAQPSVDALRLGTAVPTQEQLGHRVDLPDAMREKMEASFGTDLSAVKLYESEAVGDAGAEAVTQGSNIAFAPGMLDFSSFGGQALLGHELSHVVSQARGEVTGNGFLSNHALEARADREGAMAAAGQQIAMPTMAMSTVSAAPAAGPMQAKKTDKDVIKQQEKQQQIKGQMQQYVTDYVSKNGKQGQDGGTDFNELLKAARSQKKFKSLNDQLQKARTTENRYRDKGTEAARAVPMLATTEDWEDELDYAKNAYSANQDGQLQYGRAVSSLMDNKSREELFANKKLQNRLLNEAGAGVNAAVQQQIAAGGSTGDIMTKGVRGSAGDAASGGFFGLLRAMMGKDKIKEVVNTGDMAKAQEAVDPISDLLARFSDQAFANTNLSPQMRSNITMNNLSNRTFGAAYRYGKDEAEQGQLLRKGAAFQRPLKLDSQTALPTAAKEGDANMDFLNYLHNKRENKLNRLVDIRHAMNFVPNEGDTRALDAEDEDWYWNTVENLNQGDVTALADRVTNSTLELGDSWNTLEGDDNHKMLNGAFSAPAFESSMTSGIITDYSRLAPTSAAADFALNAMNESATRLSPERQAVLNRGQEMLGGGGSTPLRSTEEFKTKENEANEYLWQRYNRTRPRR